MKKNEVIYSSTGNDALAQGIMDLSATSDDQHSPVPASAVPTTAGSGAATSSLTVQITTAQLPRATDTSADASAELVTPKSLYIAGSPRPVSQTTPQATPKSNQSTGRNNNILPAQKAKPLRKRKEPTVTYLNVHAGVSMGVMAGLDVGANDRFEVRFVL